MREDFKVHTVVEHREVEGETESCWMYRIQGRDRALVRNLVCIQGVVAEFLAFMLLREFG